MIDALVKRLGLHITQENFQIRAEQIRVLIQSYPSMIAANAVMAPLVVWLMWNKVEHGVLLSWITLLYAFHALEVRNWLTYPKTIGGIQECKRWQRQFLLSDALGGAVWGSAGVLMFVPGDPMFQMFLLCIMMGLATGAVAGNLVFPLSQQTYVTLVITPILFSLLQQGVREYYLLAAMVGVFLIFVMKVGRDQSKFFELSIRRGFENIGLVSELQRANTLLALAQRESKSGIWDWEMDSGKLTWSNELFLLFGLDPNTSAASFDTWRNVVHPSDLQAAEKRIEEAARDGTQLFNEYRIVLPDGETKWILSVGNTSQQESDGATHMSGLCIDVTAHKQVENKLKDSEHRLSEILESVDAHIYLKDTQGRFLFANRPVRELFGVSLEEIVGKSDEHFFDAATTKQIRSNDRMVLEQGETSKKEETTFNLKDGCTSTYLSVKIPLRNEAGKIYALCGISTDITERKQAEESLLNSLRLLEEKELSKTRFLAAAGHDLRQPVAAANLFVDALKLTSPTPRQSELIARLDQSMGIFSGLLERLLDISKFDAGLIKPQFASFDLAELFSWLEQNFAQTALDRQLRFRLCFPMNRPLIVRTDIFLLQSVLMNLVSNAIKFTAQGGILICARQRGDTVILQVWDTGIGIAQAELSQIFDEFYQVANPQRSREAGLGLGLAICQRAMSLLGGEVTCRSRPGHGSVFELCLPLNGASHKVEQLPHIGTPATVDDETFLQGKRLVVVENDALVAAGMVDLLQGAGAQVRIFYSAEEALRHDDLANTDFFIADYALGGELTGLNFLVTLQQRQQTPLRAIVITGETSSQFISSVTDSPWPVLHKPVNYSKLVSALRL